MPTTAATSKPKTDKLALRKLQTQDWLAQPQGYVVGKNSQHTKAVKNRDRKVALEKYLEGVARMVDDGEGGGKKEGGCKGGGEKGRDELLFVGAWTKG
jgi:hypothetical protein